MLMSIRTEGTHLGCCDLWIKRILSLDHWLQVAVVAQSRRGWCDSGGQSEVWDRPVPGYLSHRCVHPSLPSCGEEEEPYTGKNCCCCKKHGADVPE